VCIHVRCRIRDTYAAVVTQDGAVRIISHSKRAFEATIPPPACVGVKAVRLCSELRLIILFLTSHEIAIFFIPPRPFTTNQSPRGHPKAAGPGETGSGSGNEGGGDRKRGLFDERAKEEGDIVPILLRRFSLFEVPHIFCLGCTVAR
jgi:hypothetical protein